MSAPLLSILDASGVAGVEAPLDVAATRLLYAKMVAARAYDRKASAMQRQGRLATYAPFEGQEASQIGGVAALEPRDWLVATYRDAAAMWMHGYPWKALILGRTGDERGGMAPEGVNVMPASITVGGHMIHAVGIAWAQVLKGSDAVALTYFGDGATSEGDFHEAMNFAGVFRVPVVFLCQNNGWAISMPFERQTASETIAQKADAYGMVGVRVDGNDLFAVFSATRDAVARARGGGGPTLIEAVTYRVGPHTTADDPGRYRTQEVADEWRSSRDPLERVRLWLEANDAWDADWQEGLEAAESEAVERAVEEAEALAALGPAEIFGAMYAEPTGPLLDQLAMLERDSSA